jgi:predicted glycoside hydrolase/deacetylase ChbG (UPF0249 family)
MGLGRAMTDRVLIMNADDFGRSRAVNEGVIRCHDEGIVTSATLMVRWSDAAEAGEYARGSETLGTGLHFDLGEWVFRNGAWEPAYEVISEEHRETVVEELDRQLELFRELVGREPTHIDSHQHVHRDEPVRGAVLAAAGRLGVPVREATPGIAYSGAFYGQDGKGTPVPEAITVEALVGEIERLPVGVTEMGCHPATAVDLETTYGSERVREVETLCDPRVRQAVDRAGVSLRSYRPYARR